MKKVLSTLALASIAIVGAQAQGGYVRATLGYGIPANGDVMGTTTDQQSNGNYTITNNVGSVGGGTALGVAGGYFFNENIGLDLEAYYLMGSKYTEDETTATNYSQTTVGKTAQFRLSPAVVVRASGEKIRPYARVGLLLPITGKTTYTVEANNNGNMINQVVEAKGAFSLGFTGAFGAEYRLNEKMAIFAEANYAGLRIKGSSAEVTEYTMTTGGTETNVLNGLNTMQKEMNFVDELTQSSNTYDNANPDTNKPEDVLATKVNYNNFGLRVGFTYGF